MTDPRLVGPEDDENLGVLLRNPFQELIGRLHEQLAAAGFADITPAHGMVFQHIHSGGSRLTDLADRAQLTKQSMGYLVDSLERQGYVERRADPHDRRARLVVLTDRGWDAIAAAREAIDRIEADWAARLGERKLERLRTLLRELGGAAAGRS